MVPFDDDSVCTLGEDGTIQGDFDHGECRRCGEVRKGTVLGLLNITDMVT